MTAWYYAKDSQQNGPVSTDEIVRLLATGTIGAKDLVWHEGMTDWKPAGEVAELSSKPLAPLPAAVAPVSATVNPYQPPSVSWNEVSAPEATGEEIVPGSQPLDVSACISRAWALTKRHFGLLIAVGVIYGAISFGFSFLTSLPVGFMQAGANEVEIARPSAGLQAYQAFTGIAGQILDLFLGLGLARIGLNLVSGKPADLSMLFGEGRKLGTAIVASIIYFAMVLAGLILLIVPGVYLALRFGQYQNAIVDKDLGILESLSYSSRITEGNKLNLLGLGVLCFLIALAGLLALVVGLLAALPVIYLASFVAYRWLQFGRAAVQG